MQKTTLSICFKRKVATFLLVLSTIFVQAATITSTATGGNWNVGSTWIGGVAPVAGDNVIIATTGTSSVNISTIVTQTAAGSLTINSGAILTSSANMTFGSLTINSGGLATLRRATTVLGATNISGRINFASSNTTKRTFNFNGAIVLNAGSVWDETNNGQNTIANTYNIKNSFTNNASQFTTLTLSLHSFQLSGTLSGSTAFVLPKAAFPGTFTNNGTLTCATSLSVVGSLTNNGTITAATALSGTGTLTQTATGTLNIGKAVTVTTLNSTAAGNTVNYTGAAQSVKTGNYSSLNLLGSGVKMLATGTTAIASLSISGTASATTVANVAIANTLTVGSGATITTAATNTLSVGGNTAVTGSLILGGTGTKTFNGDVALNAGSVWNETENSTIAFGGNFTNNATTFTANAGAHNFTGNTKVISGATETTIPTVNFTGNYTVNSELTSATSLNVSGATLTNNSTITASSALIGTGTFVQNATGNLNIGGTIGITSLNAATAGNTVNYNGAAQTGFVTNYSNLILSGSGIKTFATSPTVNGVLSLEGTANPLVTSGSIAYGPAATLQYNTDTARTATSEEWISPFVASGGIIIKNTGAITTPGNVQIGNNTNVPLNINSGATLNPGSGLISFHGNYINDGTLTLASGGLTIAGTFGTQLIDDFATTGPISFTKTAGTATMTGNLTGAALTINGAGGTLNLGNAFVHTLSGNVTLTAGILNGAMSTLNVNSASPLAWAGTGSVFVANNSTVNFGASGNQTVAANSSFYNLGFLGSGVKTLTNATTVSNYVAINGTAVANLGTGLTHTTTSLFLGGNPQVSGAWGSTVSPASNQSALWFGTTATGILNVNCTAPAAPVSGGDKVICQGATIPALTVTASAGQIVDWFSQAAGGTAILSNSTSYTPTVAGTFYAQTKLSGTGCVSATRTSVKLTINPKPIVLSLTGSTICATPGGNGKITSTTSQVGVNYQLFNAGNTAIQAAKPGTGNALTWLTLAAGNGYYVVETNATTGCNINSGTVNVVTTPTPTALTLTGSTICSDPGDDGIITSSASQNGIVYQLYDSTNTEVQGSQTGTGNSLTWTDLDAGSGYYIKGVNPATLCTSGNSNSVNILTNPSPAAVTVTGSTICGTSSSTGTITTSNTTTGVSYQLNDNAGNDVGTAINGNGGTITFTAVAAGTGYYVEGTRTTTGCISQSSNSVDVIVNINPANKTLTTSASSVCSGTGANVIVASSVTTESYQLRNNSGNALIGAAVIGNGGNLNLPTGNLSANTTFNVVATNINSGCTTVYTSTPTITVTPANTAGAASSNPTLCVNTVLTAVTISTTGATGIGSPTGLPAGVNAAWASNVVTISGTPTVSGTFNYSIPLTGGCGNINATGTITVKANNSAGTASANPTLCVNTALTAITISTTGATGIGSPTGLPTGVTATWSSNVITISGTPSVSGTFNYSIPLTGGCGNINAIGTITVTPASVGGTVSSNQSICAGSQVAALTLSGNVGSVLYWQKSSDAAFTTPITISNITTTLTAPEIGTVTATTYFRAVVQNNSCSIAYSSAAVITVSATVWDGTGWSNGAPTSSTAATISGDFTSTGNLNACTLTVNNGAIVNISSGNNVMLNGALTVASGSFTLANNANLLQNSNVANTGNIIVQRSSSPLIKLDYTLWSSPVAGQQLQAFSPLTLANRFYNYLSTTNLYAAADVTADFETGKGYLIRVPNNHPVVATVWTGAFTGVPNNGNFSKTMFVGDDTHRFNLIGNPYPSPISMTQFVSENNTNITGTLYFWRKTNNALSPSYCTWKAGTFVSNGEAQVVNPQGIIRTGQGFFVEATATASDVVFSNTQRIADNADQFFRTTDVVEQNRIWLNATNNLGAFSQMEFGYVTGATDGVDGFDGKYINDGNIALYGLVDAEKFVIQGRALPFNMSDIVPLGFKATTAGSFTIALDHMDGLFEGNQDIFLRDNTTQAIHDLKSGAYTFIAESGTFENRFEIIYATPLSVSTANAAINQIIAYRNNDKLEIRSGKVAIASVKVFDISGRLLAEKKGANGLEENFHANWSEGILLVETVDVNGHKSTRKVIW